MRALDENELEIEMAIGVLNSEGTGWQQAPNKFELHVVTRHVFQRLVPGAVVAVRKHERHAPYLNYKVMSVVRSAGSVTVIAVSA